MELFKLFGSILVDSKDAEASISKTEDKAKGLGTRLGEGIKTAGKWGLAIGGAAIAAGGAMLGFAKKSGDAADRLLDLNSITGMTTDEIQRWERVTKVAGVSIDAMTNASQKLTKTLDTMSTGTGKAAESAAALGFSYEDLMNMNADERMNAITQALSGVEDKTERAKLGTDLLGKSWAEIAPIVDLGTEAMNKAKDSANIVSEEDLKKANDFRIRMAEMGDQAGHFAMMIGVQALPIMNKLFDIIQDYMPQIQRTFEVAFQIIEKVVTVAVDVIDRYLVPVLSFIFSWVSEHMPEIQSIFQTAFDYIGELIQLWVELVMALWSFFGDYIIKQAKVIWDMVTGVIDGAFSIIKGLLDVFIGLFTGDWSRMGEGLRGIWDGLWKVIESITRGAWNLLRNALSFLYQNIAGWFNNLAGQALQWGRNMISGFVDGIMSMVGAVRDAIGSVMDTVSGFLGFNSPAKEGPGRYITQWGENMIEGFMDGINNAIPRLQGILPNAINAAGSSSNQSFRQTVNIYSPDPLTPSEVARRTRQANRELALEWGR